MKRYNPSEIEPKWQKTWAETKVYEAEENSDKPKKYVAGMFPYPSGAGLHVGHVRNYSIVDAIARYQRQRGFNVMNPMGWDTFGLPAENYAIKTGTPPAISTAENIKNFKNQMLRLGLSIDWSRELNTTDPEYYRWTQYLFLELFKQGLAYQKESPQWWCPVDKTVLANEQVEGGKCWRCGSEVIKKGMKQWFFKITDYADDLLEGIDDLQWPEKIKSMQRNWIGKSKGAEITWAVCDRVGNETGDTVVTFTTRKDTIPGVTFIVVAPESPLLDSLTTDDHKARVHSYRKDAVARTDIQRQESKEKTGVFTGRYAKNPFNGSVVPIWAADYVLGGYGTGVVMGMGGHDERDREFSLRHDLPNILTTEVPEEYQDTRSNKVWSGKTGKQINSGAPYDGMENQAAGDLIFEKLSSDGKARLQTNYKMRDWLISRQRYWGAPIPIIHCEKDGAVAVPDDQLPVLLPEVKDYEPDGSGKSVLARESDWLHVDCPKCGGPAVRETDTMDGYVCSSWYLFRYADANNNTAPWDPAKVNYWAPVDYYCGGDHAVAHLLYVRFWTRVFKKLGLLNFPEPVKQLVYNGYINAPDGLKMSKSKGNVVDPLELIDAGYGADALRTYELFIAPYDLDAAWDPNGIAGTYRFLNRVWNLVQEYIESEQPSEAPLASVHKTIKRVTDDLERLSFNTALAAQMELVNELYKAKSAGMASDSWSFAIGSLLKLVAPFAPHLADELWQQVGGEGSVHVASWPEWDESLLVENTITIAVQVNGKVRAELTVAKDISKDELEKLALENERVREFLGDKTPARVIVVPGRLVNVVI